MTDITKNLKAALWVPGLPHVLKPEYNKAYADLGKAMEQAGRQLNEQGVERIVYYSTQWISVLGHLYQAKKELAGYHVDENWYDLIDLPFSFKIDVPFAEKLAKRATAQGYQTKLVDYEGFPVDTGTITADRLLNQSGARSNMVSCCVYSDYADTVKLAGTVRAEIEADNVPTAVVIVSGLSGRWYTREIDFSDDAVSDAADDKWNQRMIGLFESGSYDDAEKLIGDYAGACKVDMGLKGLAFLKGLGALSAGRKARCHAYGGIYGTGAAVISF